MRREQIQHLAGLPDQRLAVTDLFDRVVVAKEPGLRVRAHASGMVVTIH